jgi:polyisoprenoid-binding protein YceI
MRTLIVVLALGLAACASVAGAGAPSLTNPVQPVIEAPGTYPVAVDLPAGSYRLDPRHASVLFRIRHMELAWFTARFDDKDAILEFDPADPSRSRLRASVEADSINTGLPEDDERAFDRQIGRAIGSGPTPQMTFVSNSIVRTGRFTGRITGDLTMNGQTHPAVLDATFDGGRADPLRGGGVVLGFSATGAIARSQWGVTQWRAFTGDDVQIVIEAELVRSAN